MTPKQIINIVVIIFLMCISASYFYLLDNNRLLKYKNTRLTENLNQLNVKNSELVFTQNELNNYIEAKDTQHKKEIDSLLKELDIKPKNLIRYQKIYIHNIDTDTTIVAVEQPRLVNDTLYQTKFSVDRKCLKIDGIIYSKDSTTRVDITKTEGNNRVYVVKSYFKTFWDIIFFRKGKVSTEVVSDCGEATNDEIHIDM